MHLEDFITRIFCWVDDNCRLLIKNKLRQRGKPPKISDSELLTMEVVGEFLGLDTDKGIWWHFKTHWQSLFPQIPSRSQFAKQAANLCGVKQKLLQQLFSLLRDETVHIVDGFPLPVTHFKRAANSKNFKGEADYGYCASKGETYFGFKGHILITLNGEIAGFYLTPANGSEREAAILLTENIRNFSITCGCL